MLSSPTNTAVAFLIFERPDFTRRVFQAIASVKPPMLFVVADGPRSDRPEDVEKCAAAQAVVEGVDWECEVFRNYSEKNLGCRERVATGLEWIFSKVERAIIIEDDVVPHPTFFRYCEELLERYADDQRVGAICGCNFQNGSWNSPYSYYFSRYHHSWGWATWARAWRNYDVTMRLWPEIRDKGYLSSIVPKRDVQQHWEMIFQRVYDVREDTWDYQWTFSSWAHSMMTILPSVNLVSNIGFGPRATHTTVVDDRAELPTEPMKFPMKHPPFVMRDPIADMYSDDRLRFFMPTFFTRLKRALRRRLSFTVR